MELDDSALSEQDPPRNPHGVFPLPHPHPMALGRGTQGVGGQSGANQAGVAQVQAAAAGPWGGGWPW